MHLLRGESAAATRADRHDFVWRCRIELAPSELSIAQFDNSDVGIRDPACPRHASEEPPGHLFGSRCRTPNPLRRPAQLVPADPTADVPGNRPFQGDRRGQTTGQRRGVRRLILGHD